MIKFEIYNQSKKIKVATYISIFIILFFLFITYLRYNTTKLNLTNPLIPQYIIEISIRPFIIKGIILISSLLGITILTYLKKNPFALLLAIVTILYYIFSDHYIGGWYTNIN